MEIRKRHRLQDLAIVLLNYNGEDLLKKFLPKIVQLSDSSAIYIIDNASSDSSKQYVEQNFPQVKWIQNDRNYGFARGYNLGLESVKEELFCLLNSDILVTDNWLSPIVDLFNSDEQIVAIQPKILSLKNPSEFEYAGAAGGYLDNLGFPFCRGRLFSTLEIDKGQYDQETEIFWASGACLFIRADIFRRLKGFDEQFFAHMEEIDLCWRIKILEKKIFYTNRSVVYHLGGGTLNYKNPKKLFLNIRNSLFVLLKNLPKSRLFKTIIFRMSLDGIFACWNLMRLKPSIFYTVFRAHVSFYRNFSSMQKKRNPTNLRFWNKKYVLFQYVIKNRKKYNELK